MRVLALVATFAAASTVFAEEPKPAKKILRIEALKVEGRIQKPQAFYILQRSNLNFEGLDLKESFLPRIGKAIDDKPF